MKRPRWTCLMYHDVVPRGGTGDYFSVPAERFSEHLATIENAGFRGVTLSQALERGGTQSVAITFDDATTSQVDEALPRLLERGMTATFFAVTGWVGLPGYASWDDLRRLKAEGMEVQSHTHSHPFLSELDPAGVASELTQSKALLDEQLEQDTRILALPGGDRPGRAAMAEVNAAGYDVIASSVFGRNSPESRETRPLLIVRRCTVRGDADGARIARVLEGDPLLFMTQQTREGLLLNLRRGLGPSRYSRWRRRFMELTRGS